MSMGLWVSMGFWDPTGGLETQLGVLGVLGVHWRNKSRSLGDVGLLGMWVFGDPWGFGKQLEVQGVVGASLENEGQGFGGVGGWWMWVFGGQSVLGDVGVCGARVGA